MLIWIPLLGQYCQHIEKAVEAKSTGNHAKVLKIELSKFQHLNLNQEHINLLQNASDSQSYLQVYSLPGNNIVVPSLYERTHENPLKYLHIKNKTCSLNMCRDKRSKLHTLLKKENPLCLHVLLNDIARVDDELVSDTTTKKTNWRISRDASVQVSHFMNFVCDSFNSTS